MFYIQWSADCHNLNWLPQPETSLLNRKSDWKIKKLSSARIDESNSICHDRRQSRNNASLNWLLLNWKSLWLHDELRHDNKKTKLAVITPSLRYKMRWKNRWLSNLSNENFPLFWHSNYRINSSSIFRIDSVDFASNLNSLSDRKTLSRRLNGLAYKWIMNGFVFIIRYSDVFCQNLNLIEIMILLFVRYAAEKTSKLVFVLV